MPGPTWRYRARMAAERGRFERHRECMGPDEETSRSTFPAGTVPRPSVVCCARGVGAPAADARLGEKPVPFSARPRARCGGGEGQLQATLRQSF